VRLAIVGSRCLEGCPEARDLVRQVIVARQPTVVVSGGAEGVDTMAAEEARAAGVDVIELAPTVRAWDGPGGFKERNMLLARNCDELVCIEGTCTTTRGAIWTARHARRLGKDVEIHRVEWTARVSA
jgi:predicted Rossmann fold nucleotide-binding protein DprA/Smf involved in DNA uptake